MKGRPRQRVPPCEYCNKEFKRQEHLERHLRTHTKERPYACDCGRMFTRQDLLHRHRRLEQCSGAPSVESSDVSSPLSTRQLGQAAEEQKTPVQLAATASMTPHGAPEAEVGHAHPSDAQGSLSLSSPGQLMPRFSMYSASPHDRRQAGTDQSGAVFAVDAAHSSSEFLQLHPLDMGFLFDEADMISNHLAQVVPPPDFDLSPSYSDQTSYSNILPPLHGPGKRVDSLELMGQGPTPSQDQDRSPMAEPSQQLAPLQNPPQYEQHASARPLAGLDEVVPKNPWDVSEAAYARLSALFATYQDPSERFHLPSRRTISRYVASWARSYHPHLPVLHLPTNNFDVKSSMLLLTVAAVGSFYGFEHSNGYPMLFVAKSIVLDKLRARHRNSSLHLLRSVPRYANVSSRSLDTSTIPAESRPRRESFDIELLQALLILVMTMAWLDRPLAEESLALGSQLAQLTREALKTSTDFSEMLSWSVWAREEEKRRTIYSAYFTLNLLTICFKVPPLLPSSEVTLPLPASEAEFRAPNAEAWNAIKQTTQSSVLSFYQCFKQLLQGTSLPQKDSNTEFGNYMLMQSLLTQIKSERQASSCQLSPSSSLQSSTLALYDAALGAWQSCWDSAIDSALDPSSLHGPLAFNSTAMLRLAHVHLAVDIQLHSSLSERDPDVLAQAFQPEMNLVVLRSPHLHQALMHAINALRIPIRVGIAFVASGRTGHWSVQHAISNFSCALLLTQWLERVHGVVATGTLAALSAEEKYLLSTVERLVEETHLEDFLGDKDEYPRRIRRVAIASLRLWAETCKGPQVYEIVHVVGETLTLAADRLGRHE